MSTMMPRSVLRHRPMYPEVQEWVVASPQHPHRALRASRLALYQCLHPIVVVGLSMFLTLLFLCAWPEISARGSEQLDTLHYGYPRVTQLDRVVGHEEGETLTHFQASNVGVDGKDTIWIYNEGQHQTPQGLSAGLSRYPIVCLAFTFVPSGAPSHPGDFFKAALGSGVPIILWPREDTNYPITIRDMFHQLLSQQPLSQLSTFVREQRAEAISSEDENHQGHHLTLLWDDPNRLPPPWKKPNQMAAPAARKGA